VTEFKKYRSKKVAELRPWKPGESMDWISVRVTDMANGSPKEGDMIARNPKNHDDQWLVAAKYFADNFEPVNVYGWSPDNLEPVNIYDSIDSFERADPITRADGSKWWWSHREKRFKPVCTYPLCQCGFIWLEGPQGGWG